MKIAQLCLITVTALLAIANPVSGDAGCKLYQTTHITVIIHDPPDPYPVTFEGDEDHYICIIPEERAN